MIDNQVQDAFVFVSSLMRQGAEWINMRMIMQALLRLRKSCRLFGKTWRVFEKTWRVFGKNVAGLV